ncbi:hypothetical protein EVAR_94490_1 [Eumeta japonica]|uniref:Uncharacterized protein n=1 Tax=Eumeta variegata TaxID=151549 RepID=A0A4C1UW16_EUMVA|nr:hypothetical protein EVAR_94490_1 [Eumeta japonica]
MMFGYASACSTRRNVSIFDTHFPQQIHSFALVPICCNSQADSVTSTKYNITQNHSEDAEAGTSGSVVIEINDEFSGEPLELKSSKGPFSPDVLDAISETQKKRFLTEIKKKNINSLSASIIKRKKEKQSNEDCITKKKLEILELQKQQEVLKLEKTKNILELDI